MVRTKDIIEIKIEKKRFVLLFLSLIISLLSAFRIYSYIFPQEQVVTYILGEVEIFVNGVWIPLKAGADISNATIRIKKGTELKIGDKIIRAEDEEVEFSISEKGKINVEKGTLIISSKEEEEKKIEERKIVSQTSEEKKTEGEDRQNPKEGKEIEKSDVQKETQSLPTDESKISDMQNTEKSKFKDQKTIPRILKVSIKDTEEQEGVKYLRTKKAVVQIETENIDKLKIGNITQSPKEGKVEILIYLKEGENKIDIFGLDTSGRILDKKTEIVYVDTKPPETKIPKKIKFE